MKSISFSFLFFILIATSLSAAKKTLATNGLWSVATNWLPNGVPDITDEVIIPTSKIVTLDSHVTVDSLVLLGQVFGNYKVDITSLFNISSGFIVGSDTITVNGNSIIAAGNVNGKTIIFKGNVNRVNGSFNTYGNTILRFDVTAQLTSSFTTNGRNLFYNSEASNCTIENYGTFNINNTALMYILSISINRIIFKNYGKIKILNGELNMQGLDATFENDSIFICPTCTLSMHSVSSTINKYVLKNTKITGNGILQNKFNPSNWFLKSGTELQCKVRLQGGNVFDSVGIQINQLYLESGSYLGTGNAIIKDSLYMAAGSIIGVAGNSGTITVLGNANIAGGSLSSKTIVFNKNISRNTGAFYMSNGHFQLNPSAVLTMNTASHLAIFQSDHIGAPSSLINYGTITKKGNNTNTIYSTINTQFKFNNFGNLRIENGTLLLQGLVAKFEYDTILIESIATLDLTGASFSNTNTYNFNNTKIDGTGFIRNPYPHSNIYFKPGTTFGGSLLLDGGFTFDSTGIQLKNLLINSGGKFSGSDTTIVKDSLYFGGGVLGRIGDQGVIVIDANAKILNGGFEGIKTFFNKDVITGPSTFNIYSSGSMIINNSATLYLLHNCSGCVAINSFNYTGNLINHGTIIKNSIGGDIHMQNLNIINDGNIIVNNGTLNISPILTNTMNFENGNIIINSPGRFGLVNLVATPNFNFNSGSITGSGIFFTKANAVANFGGTFSLNAAIDNTVHTSDGGVINDNVGITPASLTMSRGSFRGIGNTKVLGKLNLSGSAIIGQAGNTGTISVYDNAIISGATLLGKTLRLKDTCTISNFFIGSAATLVIDTLAYWLINHCSPTPLINITGGITVTAGRLFVLGKIHKIGCGKSIIQYVNFDSRGAIIVDDGELEANYPAGGGTSGGAPDGPSSGNPNGGSGGGGGSGGTTAGQGLEDGEVEIADTAVFCIKTYSAVIAIFNCRASVLFTNTGLFCLGSPNTDFSAGPPFSNPIGGTIGGNGSFSSPNNSNGGTLSPGASPGKLTFNNLTNDATGQVNIEMAGATTPGVNYDQIVVNGPLTLNGGTLQLTLINNYVPTLGTTFTIFTQTSLAGTFDSIASPNLPIDRGWKIIYNPTNIQIIYLKRFWQDFDNDSYGNITNDSLSLATPAGYVSNYTDCDDTDSKIYPSSPTIKSITNGNWTDPLIWLCSAPSNATDTIIIKHDINYNAADDTLIIDGELKIENGKTFNIGSPADLKTIIVQPGAKLTIEVGSKLNLYGILNTQLSAIINNKGTIEIYND